jgi:hypothetical protein
MPAKYLRTETISLARLSPWPGNARRGSADVIRESLDVNGQYRSLIVREHEGGKLTIMAGNNTRLQMLAQGWEEARCEVYKCTQAEARRIHSVDNRANDLATYDPDDLRAQIEAMNGDYLGTGWDEKAADRVLMDTDAAAPGTGGGEQVHWGVIISCSTEQEQAALLERLVGEGLNVRALVA